MSDLRDRIARGMESIPVPDLRRRIRETQPASEPPPRSGRSRKTLAVATSVVIAASGFSLLLWTFGSTPESISGPDTALSGKIAFSSAAHGSPTLHAVDFDAHAAMVSIGTARAAPQLEPAWSPNGQQIVFRGESEEAGAGSNYDLYLYDSEIGTTVDITPDSKSRTSQGSPTWSPSGDRIAYVEDNNSGSTINVWTGQDSMRQQLTSGATDVSPSWSPDGRHIAFARLEEHDGVLSADIWSVDVDGGSPSRLTTAPGYDAEPAWSPVVGTIAFVSDRAGTSDVYLMEPDGSSANRLTGLAAEDIEGLTWSPDGSAIAFQAYRNGNWDVFVVIVGSAAVTDLGNQLDGHEVSPAWAPDGGHVAFLAGRVSENVANAGDRDMYVVRPDGTDLERLTVGVGAMEGLSWQTRLDTGV